MKNFRDIEIYEGVRERFYSMFSPEPNSGCWLWIASGNTDGYGQIMIRNKTRSAHRVSWKLHYGKLPLDSLVCHKCDVPCCVNPDHLFLGTYKDNIVDCIEKGRFEPPGTKGERHGSAKLNEQDVKFIRKYARSHDNFGRDLASIFGVTRGTISNIVCRYTWKHLP